MSEREDYAEPGPAPGWERPAMRRRAYSCGIAFLSLVAAVIAFFAFCVRATDRHYNVVKSVHDADQLVRACENYRQFHPDKTYPARLTDLLNSWDGHGPFYDAPDDKITDGWGNPFRYALVPNAAGELEPYVWAEHTRNGKTTLHGAKLGADGTVVVFGLPND